MSTINNGSAGVQSYGTPAISRPDNSQPTNPASSLASWRGEEDLGLRNDFQVPQSTSSKPQRRPDSLELLAAARAGLAIVSEGSLKNPDRYL
ncbi:MAG: hypothetical protein V4684_13775 [Pseudomonadota bacterium]